jgi:hypothetical protein
VKAPFLQAFLLRITLDTQNQKKMIHKTANRPDTVADPQREKTCALNPRASSGLFFNREVDAPAFIPAGAFLMPENRRMNGRMQGSQDIERRNRKGSAEYRAKRSKKRDKRKLNKFDD